MSTIAVAYLRWVHMGREITEYLERIDDTLQAFGGRFLVHGGSIEKLEGEWRGDLILIEFPNREQARGWYRSTAYQAILPLRTRNSEGDVALVDTVSGDHHAIDVLNEDG